MGSNDFKNRFMDEVRLHKETIERYVGANYAKVECAVNSLMDEKNPKIFLNKLEQTNQTIRECCDKFKKIIDIFTCTESEKLVQNPSPVSLTVSPCSIVYGEQYSVELLHPGSPNNFWLKLKNVSLQSLEEDLFKFYSSASLVEKNPNEEDFVVCHHNNKYCRAKVIKVVNISKELSEIKVLLIDYGEYVNSSPEKLYPLEEQFCKESAIGLSCTIHSIKPVGDGWPLHAVTSFNSYLYENQNNDLVAIFHPLCGSERPASPFCPSTADFSVTLLMKEVSFDSVKFVDISSKLILNGIAKRVDEDSSLVNETRSVSPVSDSNFVSVRSFSKSDHSESSEKSSHFTNSTRKPSEAPTYNSIVNAQSRTNQERASSALNPNAFEFKPNTIPTFLRAAPLEMANSQCQLLNLNYSQRPMIKNAASSITATVQMAVNFPKIHSHNSNYPTSINIPFVPSVPGAHLYPTRPLSMPSTVPSSLKNEHMKEVDIDDFLLQPKEDEANCFSVRKPDHFLMERFLNSQKDFGGKSCDEDLEVESRSTLTVTSQVTDNVTSVSRYQPTQPINPLRNLNEQVEPILRPSRFVDEKNCQVKVFLTHVNSPTDFYVFVMEDVEQYLERLVLLLDKIYNSSKPIPYLQPKVGSFWVVFDSEENIWARAQVIEYEPNKPVRIRFVDHGYETSVPVYQFRYMDKEIAEIPCLAVPCRLEGIFPADNNENGVWSKEATNKFKELVGFDHPHTALCSSTSDCKEKRLDLILFNGNNFDQLTFNELLVECNLAVADPDASKKLGECIQNSRFDLWDPMAEDMYSPRNNIALDTENYDAVSRGYIPQDEKRICRFFRTRGTCYKGHKCQQLHVNPKSNIFTTDTVETFTSLPELPLPTPGSVLALQVSCIIQPYRFYAVFPYGIKDIIRDKNLVEDGETLETLQASLQREYNNNLSLLRLTIPPLDSEIVIAKSAIDKKWYRGKVMSQASEPLSFSVFFLDYGTTEIVSMNNICKPMARFMHYPAQAVECVLYGVDSDPRNVTEEGIAMFRELVKDRDLMAKVEENVPLVSVVLYCAVDGKHININQNLIQHEVPESKFNKPCKDSSVIGKIPG